MATIIWTVEVQSASATEHADWKTYLDADAPEHDVREDDDANNKITLTMERTREVPS